MLQIPSKSFRHNSLPRVVRGVMCTVLYAAQASRVAKLELALALLLCRQNVPNKPKIRQHNSKRIKNEQFALLHQRTSEDFDKIPGLLYPSLYSMVSLYSFTFSILLIPSSFCPSITCLFDLFLTIPVNRAS